jgi:hypothetical protein
MPNVRSRNKKYVSAWIDKKTRAGLVKIAQQQEKSLSDVVNEMSLAYIASVYSVSSNEDVLAHPINSSDYSSISARKKTCWDAARKVLAKRKNRPTARPTV